LYISNPKQLPDKSMDATTRQMGRAWRALKFGRAEFSALSARQNPARIRRA
jgi:hypothetical protein